MKNLVSIYTTHYNRPEFVALQYNQLKKYCKDNFRYIVINNGINEEICNEISTNASICEEIRIHNDNRQKFCSFDHIKCLEKVYPKYIAEDNAAIRVIMDCDIFPFKQFSFFNIMEDNEIVGLYYESGMPYSSAIFTMYNFTVDLTNFRICGGFGDSGSGTTNLIKKYKTKWVKHTAPIREKEMKVIFDNIGAYKSEYGFHFIDDCLLHYYRGTGWDINRIKNWQLEKTNCLLDFLSNTEKYNPKFKEKLWYEYALFEQWWKPEKYNLR